MRIKARLERLEANEEFIYKPFVTVGDEIAEDGTLYLQEAETKRAYASWEHVYQDYPANEFNFFHLVDA